MSRSWLPDAFMQIVEIQIPNYVPRHVIERIEVEDGVSVRYLLDAKAWLQYRTHYGGLLLTHAVENEDADPDVVRLVLKSFESSHSKKEVESINWMVFSK